MKDVLFVLVIGLAAIVLQTTFLSFAVGNDYKPDLILIFIVWASTRIQFLAAVGLAFFGGLVVDLFSGSPSGLFSITYCVMILTIGYMDSKFQVESNSAKAIMVFVSSLAVGCIIMIMRRAAGPVEFVWSVGQWIIFKSGITGLVSLMIFPALDTIWSGYSRLVGTR